MQQTLGFLTSLPFGLEAEARLLVPPEQAETLAKGGAEYRAGFVGASEEQALIDAIDGQGWIEDLRRRVQHYGYRYDYQKRDLTEDDRIGALPGWVLPLCDKLVAQGVFESRPDQLIVNEYLPGQGIAPHADRNCFGPVVASVSLGSDCSMDICRNPRNKQDAFQIVLERCSLLVLRGTARERWLHGIRPNKTDSQDGRKFPRSRRLSLTFRTVPLPGRAAQGAGA